MNGFSLLNDDDDNGKEDPADPNQVEDLQEAKAEIVRLRNLLAKQQVVTSPSKATSVQQSNLKNGVYTSKKAIRIILVVVVLSSVVEISMESIQQKHWIT